MTEYAQKNRAARRGRDPMTLALRGRAIMPGFREGTSDAQGGVWEARETEAPSPFLTALANLHPDKIATDATLPNCPVCAAPAIAGYLHRDWHDLAHDCNCVLECEQAYLAGLRRIWQRQQAYPHYLATLPERYRAYTLDNLRVTPENKKAVSLVRAGLTGNAFFYGPAGTGKTHLAVAAAGELAKQGKTARFWGMASLFKAMRDVFSSDGEQPRPELAHWDVLVLDDIDKLKPSQFVYETLYEFIETRWAAGKITIFTAQFEPNQSAVILTPGGNEHAADPLASRMSSGIVEFIGGDDSRAEGGF